METILFIDGRNFIEKLAAVLDTGDNKNIDFSLYNFRGLIDKVLAGIDIDKKFFYLGKITKHPQTPEKSEALIQKQRILKTHLEDQGFDVILEGHVRGNLATCPKGHAMLTFKEKGVDVKMAVDMVSGACTKQLKLAVIGSSDSDLQPAIKELSNRGVERIYLGFEVSPNKGLTYTTSRTILIRNSEVREFAHSVDSMNE